MNFAYTYQQMLDRTKWHTRRLEKPGDAWYRRRSRIGAGLVLYRADCEVLKPGFNDDPSAGPIIKVIRKGRTIYEVGKDYAIQPGRTAKDIGRTPPVVAIRRERLQEISTDDVIAEGIDVMSQLPFPPSAAHLSEEKLDALIFVIAQTLFAELWDRTATKPGTDWASNPMVYPLVFEH